MVEHVSPLVPPRPFPEAARDALRDTQLRRNLAKATTTIRGKTATVIGEMPDWEALRVAGERIKDRVLRHLDHYLEQLEASITAAGGHVHWARDAAEAVDVIARIVNDTGASEVSGSRPRGCPHRAPSRC